MTTPAPLFEANWQRASGALLHPTSLPGQQGIGSLGSEARLWLDFLKEAGFEYWQVCPLGPTGYGDSPYQTFSAFAGNPYLIDLKTLQAEGLLEDDDLDSLRKLPKNRVDFGALYAAFWPILNKAYSQHQKNPAPRAADIAAFKKAHGGWLYPYAAFMAFKDYHQGAPWWQWEACLRTFKKAQGTALFKKLASTMEAWVFYQYLFFKHWAAIKTYAHAQGIQIIGDIPIFVSADSADIWTHPELFEVDDAGLPSAQAGVPPDYFSADGQLWGNPLYNWQALKNIGYSWWLDRIRLNLTFFDVIRLDHFRGFESYWQVPIGAKDARGGQWQPGPGLDFFKAVNKAFPKIAMIAEDLGNITPAVRALLNATGLPGMAILQFAFAGEAKNPYLPHNHRRHNVVYPGSHDNDTSQGWYNSASEATKDHVRRYLRISGQEIAWDLIRSALASPAQLSIIALQDLLSLRSEARMNFPGKPEGNWQWRYEEAALADLRQNSARYLREIHILYGRL